MSIHDMVKRNEMSARIQKQGYVPSEADRIALVLADQGCPPTKENIHRINRDK